MRILGQDPHNSSQNSHNSGQTKWMLIKKLFKGQNGVCVIICMIVIVGLLFVQITALIVDIINVPRKGLANEEIDFLFGIVVESSLARSNSVNEIDNKKRRKSDATAITKKVMITPLKIGVAILSM
ncbi:5842_t:CDS:2, partial [Rhizophagus irregularis]